MSAIPGDEALSRRQFLSQAAAVGAAAVMPVKIFGAAAAVTSHEIVTEHELSTGWSIKPVPPQEGLSSSLLSEAARPSATNHWLPVAVMPAMVHEILLAQGKIEEPWRSGGVEKCAWVAATDWLYALRFPAPPRRESYLRFRGLEGAVEVYLNGERIASHTDVNAPLDVRVTGRLGEENSLVLHFLSGSRRGPSQATVQRNPLGSYLGPNPDLFVFGVFDQVVLQLSSGSRFDEVLVDALLDEPLSKGTLTVDAAGSSHLPAVSVRVRLYGPDGAQAGEAISRSTVSGGAFRSRCEINVDRPRLWWPRGYGEQPLYRAEVSLLTDGQLQQTQQQRVGFRRISMPRHLHFVVNNVPVFLRGASFVTENLLTRVWDQARDEKLFALAKNANFNTFRIWGEAATPRDNFYDMADAHGFLLWQDLSLLPLKPDEQSRAVCREMATQQIKRLKHHPSIFCWCGGNEAAMWFHEDYDTDFADHGPWPGLVAAEDVGLICKRLDPNRYYQPSSPYSVDGMDPNDPRAGDTHGYTNTWFVPGYDYLTFATEDTRIAAPPLHSLKKFMAADDIFPAGYSTLWLKDTKYPFPTTWLPYTTAESWKKVGPVEQFCDATDAASLVQRLGMADVLYYQETVERQRRGRAAGDPAGDRRCGGYLAWKFNDSWPQIYSAKVDYFLEPYHAYYALKRAYAPVILSFDIGAFIYLWVVNDGVTAVSGTVRIRLYHLERNEFRKEIVRQVSAAPGTSIVAVQLDHAGIRAFRREHILFATLSDASGLVIARTNAFVEIERRLAFPDAVLTLKVEKETLQISTDKFARTIILEGDANGSPFGWHFDDNYFDLLPGEVKSVRVLGQHREGHITAKSWYSSQATTVSWRLPA